MLYAIILIETIVIIFLTRTIVVLIKERKALDRRLDAIGKELDGLLEMARNLNDRAS